MYSKKRFFKRTPIAKPYRGEGGAYDEFPIAKSVLVPSV